MPMARNFFAPCHVHVGPMFSSPHPHAPNALNISDDPFSSSEIIGERILSIRVNPAFVMVLKRRKHIAMGKREKGNEGIELGDQSPVK
jgi:hypothetical protein